MLRYYRLKGGKHPVILANQSDCSASPFLSFFLPASAGGEPGKNSGAHCTLAFSFVHLLGAPGGERSDRPAGVVPAITVSNSCPAARKRTRERPSACHEGPRTEQESVEGTLGARARRTARLDGAPVGRVPPFIHARCRPVGAAGWTGRRKADA